jgi:hypothetical protein
MAHRGSSWARAGRCTAAPVASSHLLLELLKSGSSWVARPCQIKAASSSFNLPMDIEAMKTIPISNLRQSNI